jgi:hypothetical protein
MLVEAEPEAVVATAPEAAVMAEAPETPTVEPTVPAQPDTPVAAPPVFRPLEPMGPILPPARPPIQPMPAPRMDFEMPVPPPAYLLPRAPQQAAPYQPSIPAGLFDGPAPAIKPCGECALPLSARARFCRRCGTPQI